METSIFAITPFAALLVQEQGPSIISIVTLIFGLLIAAVILAIIAPKLRIPYSILLVLGGLFLGFIPLTPNFNLNPDVVFLLFLPPLLYASAWQTSWRDFRANLRSISLLAIGLVLATTVVVAAVAHLLIPGISWGMGFVLGAIVSPTDAVAATAIAQRLGVPQRIITILEGESLVNDATGLVVYQFAVAAVFSGAFSIGQLGLEFVFVSLGGIALGLVAGWGLNRLHRWLENPPLEITITLITPFAVYILGEDFLHVSGVLATVTTGLYLTWRAPNFFSPESRQQANAVWGTLIFLLNGLIFLLIGLQLPEILGSLDTSTTGYTPIDLIWYGVLVSLTVIIVRLLWTFPEVVLPRLLFKRIRAREPIPDWRSVLVIGWTGMRGAVSLAAALALPELTNKGTPFPERALVIYLTYCVILATLVVQGLSLPFLIRKLGLRDDGASDREDLKARKVAAEAALIHLNELSGQEDVSEDLAQHLRQHYKARIRSLTKGAEQSDDILDEHDAQAYQELQREALNAERSAVINLRNRGEINDEVLRRIERELDLEQQRLDGKAKKV